jgi:hypothetical protein
MLFLTLKKTPVRPRLMTTDTKTPSYANTDIRLLRLTMQQSTVSVALCQSHLDAGG